ncbi:MAG: electron transfer flavoprotein subunit beta/FixA family protein [Peptoniphilus sp.]|nr:electron transfer flavoprotein subunit beta/FixA family protein [Peptoniphilus sp.]
MKYLVCIKRVPKFPNKIKLDPVTNNLIRDGSISVINPADLNALNFAFKLREQTGGTVTTLTMGSPGAVKGVKECLVRGADHAYVVSDGKFRGADTLATSYTLAKAAEFLGGFDVVLTGAQTTDGDTGQVGPELAERLGINQVTYIKDVNFQDGNFVALRSLLKGTEKQRVKAPVLFSVLRDSNKVTPARKSKIEELSDDLVGILSGEDIGVDYSRVGLEGSATNVVTVFQYDEKAKGSFVEGNTDEQVDALIKILDSNNFI